MEDFIIERGGIEKIKVTQELLRLCERARERYGAFLTAEESRRTDKTSQSERRVGQANKRCSIRRSEQDTVFEEGIEVAETSVEEINHRLGEAMNRKTLNPDKIVLCQRKITMGLKRKTELNKNLRKLE